MIYVLQVTGHIKWKMSFNPDRSKQAQEVIFLRKTSIQSHPVLTFDNYVGLY